MSANAIEVKEALAKYFPEYQLDPDTYIGQICSIQEDNNADIVALIKGAYNDLRLRFPGWYNVHEAISERAGDALKLESQVAPKEPTDRIIEFVRSANELWLAVGSFNTRIYNNEKVIRIFKEKFDNSDLHMHVYCCNMIMVDDISGENLFVDKILPMYFEAKRLDGFIFNSRLLFHFLSDGNSLIYQNFHNESTVKRINYSINNNSELTRWASTIAIPSSSPREAIDLISLPKLARKNKSEYLKIDF